MIFNNNPKTLETVVKVERVIYPRGSTGDCWGIVSLKDIENKFQPPFADWTHDFVFNAKGQLPELDLGATYKFVGKLVTDEKYGDSYEIVYMGINLAMNNAQECQNFLSVVLSDAQIEKMIEHFGDYQAILDCIKKEDVTLLQEVKGIGETNANKILSQYKVNKEYEHAFKELAQFNIPNNLLKKILKSYSTIHEAVNIIKTNPYALAGKIKGIAFATTDSIGKKIGIAEDSPKRITGFLLWYFDNIAQNNGHTWTLIDNVIKDVCKQLKLDKTYSSTIRECLMKLRDSKHCTYVESADTIGLTRYFEVEKKIARELIRLIETQEDLEYDDFETNLQRMEQECGFSLTDEQVDATKTILENPICIVTGSAGVRKNSIIKTSTVFTATLSLYCLLCIVWTCLITHRRSNWI